jgi:hypothetical protein
MIIRNSNPNLFVVFEVKTLRKFKYSTIKKGSVAFASLMPNNRIYLSESGIVGSPPHLGQVFETNAIENVDFVRVNDN